MFFDFLLFFSGSYWGSVVLLVLVLGSGDVVFRFLFSIRGFDGFVFYVGFLRWGIELGIRLWGVEVRL